MTRPWHGARSPFTRGTVTPEKKQAQIVQHGPSDQGGQVNRTSGEREERPSTIRPFIPAFALAGFTLLLIAVLVALVLL